MMRKEDKAFISGLLLFVTFASLFIVIVSVVPHESYDLPSKRPNHHRPSGVEIPWSPPLPPPSPPEIKILRNSTIVKKWDRSGVIACADPPCVIPYHYYYIKLEDGYKKMIGRSTWKKVEVGDHYFSWRREGWFQPSHGNITRDGELIYEW